jgi:hypothetical protein
MLIYIHKCLEIYSNVKKIFIIFLKNIHLILKNGHKLIIKCFFLLTSE